MAENALERENKMGTEKMSRLVIVTGAPLMVSLLINSLYNFVDSVFVARISEQALTALSLAWPVQLLCSALGFGNAIGLNAVISRALGEGDRAKVKRAADSAIFLAICAWALICVLCLAGVRWYFDWQSGGDEVIAAYGRDYLTVCMLFSFGQMGQWVFDRFVMASGKGHLFLFTLSAASLTNLALDPIFIFGLFGVPRLEALGAAIATVIGQVVGLLAGIFINRRWNKEIPFSLPPRPDGPCIREILRIGVPSSMIDILTALLTVVMNSILLGFSATAVAVCGVMTKIRGVVTVGTHGIDNGLIPIVAYNLGARKHERIDQAIRWALIFSAVIFTVIFAGLELFPGPVLRLFDASEDMMAMGTGALRIFALAWFLCIPGMIYAAALQGLGQGGRSMALTMARQAVLPVAFALALRPAGSLTLMWWAFVLAEAAGLPLGAYLWRRTRRTVETEMAG